MAGLLVGCNLRGGETGQPTRNVVFDAWTLTSGKAEDVLQFSGLDSPAGYQLELQFLVPNKGRAIGRITAGGKVLAEQVVVEPTYGNNPMPAARLWKIPAAAIQNGRLEIALQDIEIALQGDEARLSPKLKSFPIQVKVIASDPGAKPLNAVLPSKIEVPVVRLTPRPVEIAGLAELKVDLGGFWSVNMKPENEFWKLAQLPDQGWKAAEVPGELAMQGFELEGGFEPGERRNAVAYWREFKVPDTWRGNRIKLKCDAIFNDARVWINGSEAGAHVGNFTPFELDITELVKFGHKNVIAVAVRVDWEVDHMAWATAFVGHSPLGILRKIYLFAVPQVNVADVHVLTTFDKDYHDAVLTAQVHVVNESDRVTRDLKLRLGLRGRHQAEDAVAPVTVLLPEIQPGGSIVQEVAIAVPAPRKWDAEHPNLYDLSTALLQDGLVTEVTKERIGFRQVEIRGSQVLINNQPVRYRGVVWHETDPRRGRSLTGDAWHRDMQLLRAMNCNYIRFQCVSGPPAEELVEACDEVGIFLEDELPVCWSSKGTRHALSSVLQAAVEMVIRDRSRASVIQWSLGNELLVDQHLMIAHRLAMKHLDSSRPYLTDGSGIQMPIRNDHYTSIRHFYVWAASPVPVMQGEWGHVACYNRQEIYTDPGVRDGFTVF